MRDIPYGRWAEYVIDRLRRYGVRAEDDCVLLELGCGTGSMSRYFCMEGYKVVGIDLSESMVKEAAGKALRHIGLICEYLSCAVEAVTEW